MAIFYDCLYRRAAAGAAVRYYFYIFH